KRLSRDSRSKRYPALQGAVVSPRAVLRIPISPPPGDQAAGGRYKARLVLPRNGRQHRFAALDGHLDRRYAQAFLVILERQLVVAGIQRDMLAGLRVDELHHPAALADNNLDVITIRPDDQLAVVGGDAIDAHAEQPGDEERQGRYGDHEPGSPSLPDGGL